MLMTAMHMDSTHGHRPSSSPATSTPPWLPANHHHLLYDFAACTPSPSPPSPATAAPSSHHHLLRAATTSRRVAKRRPRPSRRLPTTYITADPASFRRMVHQVTGADDLPLPPPEVLCRPAPARAGSTGPGALMLPTLDTSAFLIGTGAALARTGADAPFDGSAAFMAASAPALTVEADGAGEAYNNSAGSCGFPTLESWDPLV